MVEQRLMCLQLLTAVLLTLTVSQLQAAGITIPTGGSFSLGDGNVNLSCGDLVVAGNMTVDSGNAEGISDVEINSGTLDGGAGTLALAGDWFNTGSFIEGTSEVQLGDGCATAGSIILGNNDFYRLAVSTSTAKVLSVSAGSTQTFASRLELEGAVGDELQIRSTSPGQVVFFTLAPGGTQSIFAVDVQDNDASGGETLAPGTPGQYQSIDSGNNTNWFVGILQELFRDGFENL